MGARRWRCWGFVLVLLGTHGLTPTASLSLTPEAADAPEAELVLQDDGHDEHGRSLVPVPATDVSRAAPLAPTTPATVALAATQPQEGTAAGLGTDGALSLVQAKPEPKPEPQHLPVAAVLSAGGPPGRMPSRLLGLMDVANATSDDISRDLELLGGLPPQFQPLLSTDRLIMRLRSLSFITNNPLLRQYAERLLRRPRFALFLMRQVPPEVASWAVGFVQRQDPPAAREHPLPWDARLETQSLVSLGVASRFYTQRVYSPVNPLHPPPVTIALSNNLLADSMLTHFLHALVVNLMSAFVMLFCLSSLYTYFVQAHGQLLPTDALILLFVGFLWLRPGIFGTAVV